MIRTALSALTWILICEVASAALGITRHTVDGGGGLSSNGNLRLSGTTGQPEARPVVAANANWKLRGGFWVGVVQTATSTEPADHLPAAFQLHRNAPNPFNPSTTISFDLPRSGRVRVSIHNVRGELVRVLRDEQFAAGRHQAVWNGRDDQGVGVASGIYLVSVRADGMEARQKITMVK